jgi:hypothetical protein
MFKILCLVVAMMCVGGEMLVCASGMIDQPNATNLVLGTVAELASVFLLWVIAKEAERAALALGN